AVVLPAGVRSRRSVEPVGPSSASPPCHDPVVGLILPWILLAVILRQGLDRRCASHYATAVCPESTPGGRAVPRRAFLWLALAACLAAGCQERPRPKYRIAVIPKGLTHEFWQSIHRGAERGAADLGSEQGIPVEVIWDGPLRERDALAQIRIVDRRIST